MMADYDNNLRGVLFKNTRKTKDSQPDYRGSCEIEGVEYWIAGWKKVPKSGGDSFLSLAFSVKDEDEKAKLPREEKPGVSDDIPF
jgi:uncharacterized protein (DUF736 family)